MTTLKQDQTRFAANAIFVAKTLDNSILGKVIHKTMLAQRQRCTQLTFSCPVHQPSQLELLEGFDPFWDSFASQS